LVSGKGEKHSRTGLAVVFVEGKHLPRRKGVAFVDLGEDKRKGGDWQEYLSRKTGKRGGGGLICTHQEVTGKRKKVRNADHAVPEKGERIIPIECRTRGKEKGEEHG